MAENKSKSLGTITQIIGAVLDIQFEKGQLPEINDAVEIHRTDGDTLVVEVAQHLGDNTVRCIAMRQMVWFAAWKRYQKGHRSGCR